jgi:hypothetical protein
MNWNDVMGLVSTVSLSLPILTMIAMGLAGYRSFPALVIYYAIVVFYNVLQLDYVHAEKGVIFYFGIANNLLDAPLMLLFLSYFSPTQHLKKRMDILVGIFVTFEIAVLVIFGMTVKAVTIIMAPGFLLILGFCIPFFVRQTKITISHHKAMGKAMITASLLFAYGCYTIIYVMYYLMDIRNEEDTFLVYFFITTLSSLLMSAGIIIERKRIKKLSELKVVRKELSELYANEKTAAPLKAAVFDFDKEQWN